MIVVCLNVLCGRCCTVMKIIEPVTLPVIQITQQSLPVHLPVVRKGLVLHGGRAEQPKLCVVSRGFEIPFIIYVVENQALGT